MSEQEEQPLLDAEPEAPKSMEVIPPKPKTGASLVPVTEEGVAFKSLADLIGFAGMVVKSGLAPKGMGSEGVAAAMVMGRGFGLNEMSAMQQIVPVNGQLSWRGQAAVALIRNSGKCVPGTLKFWTEGEGSDAVGIAVAQRVGDKTPERREFTISNAKRAGLLPAKEGSGWTKYPDRMLMWRAVGFIARDLFSDVLGGFPLAEEAVDFESPSDHDSRPRVGVTSSPDSAPPAKPDPFLSAIAGDLADGIKSVVEARDEDIVEAELVLEDQETEPPDTCDHGKTLDIECADCDADDREAAKQAELDLAGGA